MAEYPSDMTVASIRDDALTERSMTLKGTDHQKKLRRLMNDALNKFTTDVPFGLRVERFMTTIPVDVDGESTDVAAKMTTTTDASVLEITADGGGVLGVDSDWRPTVDGTWDGEMWIAIYHPTEERWIMFESRRWYLGNGTVGTKGHYYVSLMTPWPSFAALSSPVTDMRFRIFARYVYLPADVERMVEEPRLYSNEGNEVGRVSFKDASAVGWNDSMVIKWANGPPKAIWHVEKRQPVRAVNFTPTLAAGGGGTWVGPVQEGDWYVRFTIALGKQDPWWATSPNSASLVDPLWESAPSPPSAVFSHAAGANAGKAIVMTFADIAAIENFKPLVATLRSNRPGFKIRVYVANTSVRTAGAGTYNNVPADGSYHLLTELEDGVSSYTWTGAAVPQEHRRLRPFSGSYDAYAIWPRPNKIYSMEFRGVRLPAPLETDSDVIPIEADYRHCFKLLYLAFMCRGDGGDFAAAAEYERLYKAAVDDFRSLQTKKGRVHRRGIFTRLAHGTEMFGTSEGVKFRAT